MTRGSGEPVQKQKKKLKAERATDKAYVIIRLVRVIQFKAFTAHFAQGAKNAKKNKKSKTNKPQTNTDTHGQKIGNSLSR